MDRSTANMHLSKVLSYVQCGKPEKALDHVEALKMWLWEVEQAGSKRLVFQQTGLSSE